MARSKRKRLGGTPERHRKMFQDAKRTFSEAIIDVSSRSAEGNCNGAFAALQAAQRAQGRMLAHSVFTDDREAARRTENAFKSLRKATQQTRRACKIKMG